MNAVSAENDDWFLPLLDPRVYKTKGSGKAAQHALLAIKRGLTRPMLLAKVPSLAHASRRRRAIDLLIDMGWVREANHRLEIIEDRPRPVPSNDARAAISSGVYLRKTVAMLSGPRTLLDARGLSALARVLTDEETEALLHMIERCEEYAAADRARSRREKKGIMAHVVRRVPAEFLDASGTRPRHAPRAVGRGIYHLLTDGCSDREERRAIHEEIRRLYPLVAVLDDEAIDHLWRIAEAQAAVFPTYRGRLGAVRTRLASYLARRQQLRGVLCRMLEDCIPKRDPHPDDDTGVALPGAQPQWDWQALQRRFPVPDCGDGPWVSEENRLWDRFRALFGPAAGPATKDLWQRAHERLATCPVAPDEYETRLFAAAEAIAGFASNVMAALRRGDENSPLVRRCLAASTGEWDAYEERRALRRALRYARDNAPGARTDAGQRVIDLQNTRPENWAPRRVLELIRREMGQRVDPEVERRLEADAQRDLGPRRARRPKRGIEREVRSMMIRLGCVQVSRKASGFPYQQVIRHFEPVKEMIQAEVEPEMRQRGRVAFAEYLGRRATVRMIAADESVEYLSLTEGARAAGDLVAVTHVLLEMGLSLVLRRADEEALYCRYVDRALPIPELKPTRGAGWTRRLPSTQPSVEK